MQENKITLRHTFVSITAVASSAAAASLACSAISAGFLGAALAPRAVFAQSRAATAAVPSPVALSPDGVRTATVNAQNQLVIQNRSTTGAAPLTLNLTKSRITALAFSANGLYVAVASDDRTIRVVESQTGRKVRDLEQPPAPKFPRGTTAPASVISALAFDPSGTQLLSADSGYRWIVRYEGRSPADLGYKDAKFTTKPLYSLASDAQGGWIGGDNEGRFHFFNAFLVELGMTTPRTAGVIRSISVSPDARFLASGGDDAEIKLWNFRNVDVAVVGGTFVLRDRFNAASPLLNVVFRRDGRLLLAADRTARVKEWSYIQSAGSGLGTNVANNNNTANTTPPVVTPPVTPPVVTPPVTPPVVTPPTNPPVTPPANNGTTGTKVATGTKLPPPGTALRPRVAKLRTFIGHSEYVNSVAFSADGTTLASGSRDKTVRLWDVATGEQKALLGKHGNYVSSVAFSPNGETLASAGWDNRIRLWDLSSEKEITNKKLTGHTSYVLSLDFSPDSTKLISGSNDKTARLWSLTSSAAAAKSSGVEPEAIAAIAYSPDGKRIAGGCLDGTVYLWDAATMKVVRKLYASPGLAIYSLAFLDNATLVSGGKAGYVRVWNVNTGKLGTTLLGAGKDVFSVAYNAKKKLLACGGADKLIRVWYLPDTARVRTTKATLKPALQLTGHANTVRSVSFSDDGEMMASGGWDYNVLLWRVTMGQTSPATADANAVPVAPSGG